ncbi:MAG: DNA primase, partial [Eubacterium sp.]|nr:DNA primase [Eubacterium sp.]
MFYPQEVVDEVISRNDILDVISSYLGNLKRAGSNYTCCCPFHNERTPSFSVSRSKQMFYCFGCHEGGNVIGFVMKYEHFGFQEALKMLADRAGIALPEVELTEEEKRSVDR